MTKNTRFNVIYRICGNKKAAEEVAAEICFEQTVEFPDPLIPNDSIRNNVVGRIESFRNIDSAYEAVISYPVEAAAAELTQFINVIFGNISLKPGIRLKRLVLPDNFLRIFKGPRYGCKGLRKLLKVSRRPLLCTALKPLGLTADELAKRAYQFALGGIDIIKDDHGLTDQSYANFNDRVKACAQAVALANRKTGFKCIYAANVTAPVDQIKKRALMAKSYGAGALMNAPGITGFDAMRDLAEDEDIALPVLSHPAFQGSFVVSPQSGISHYVIFGQLIRMSGADAVIFPNYGGRFSFTRQDCSDIVDGCRVKMGRLKDILPCPGGGMSLERIPDMAKFYGRDVIYLIGGALFARGENLADNCRYFSQLVRKYAVR